MKFVFLSIVLSVVLANLSEGADLQIGSPIGATLAYLENVKLSSIPLTTRTKTVFYSSEKNQIIRAVVARDLDNSKAKAVVSAGGVGSTFVNIQMKSERGKGLNYQVQIFH